MAGLNAAARAGGGPAIIFDRAEGYLGVMIDDLVTRGITEPYRMFTSRAEYRLTLARRQRRPAPDREGHRDRLRRRRRGSAQFEAKIAALEAARALANSLSITPNEAEKHGISLNRDGQRRTAFELLSYPNLGLPEVARIWPQFAEFAPKIAEQLEIDAKYAVYLDRQTADIESYRRDESFELPDELDYAALPGLSHELRQKLQTLRPAHHRPGRPHRWHHAGGADAPGRPRPPRRQGPPAA